MPGIWRPLAARQEHGWRGGTAAACRLFPESKFQLSSGGRSVIELDIEADFHDCRCGPPVQGDRIKAVVLGMDDDYRRISLSTAELEPEDGDMITNKVCVVAKAQLRFFFLQRPAAYVHTSGEADTGGDHSKAALSHSAVSSLLSRRSVAG